MLDAPRASASLRPRRRGAFGALDPARPREPTAGADCGKKGKDVMLRIYGVMLEWLEGASSVDCSDCAVRPRARGAIAAREFVCDFELR